MVTSWARSEGHAPSDDAEISTSLPVYPRGATATPHAAARILQVARALVSAQSDANRRLYGELVLHYPSRDVTVLLDGDTGLRVMRLFLQPDATEFADPIGPGSDADRGWLALDLDQLMAISWQIASPNPTRLAVDPPAAA
jgi:hypothetical protein